MATFKQSIYRFGAIAAVVGVVLSPVVASAVTTNTTVTANVAATITVSSASGTVALNVTPTGSGSLSTQKDDVTVTTNDTLGYTLTIQDVDANTNLVSGANNIASSAGTFAAPTASDLVADTWGYRVDGVGSFGAGPTTAVTDQASSALKWAGVPANGSAHTIKNTSAAAVSGDLTSFWYGVKATTAKPSGAYADVVVYTALAK